jgi:glycosyltransferase involved in cell wall biosynthesis
VNVLLVVPWDQETGGVASVVGNLARELQRRGHGVVFLHPGDAERPTPRTTKWGFAGYELNLRTPFIAEHPLRSVVAFLATLVPTLWRLSALLRRERIEIVNIHYPLEAFAYFGVLRWLLPMRLVVSVHGADLFPGGERQAAYPASLRFLVRSADAIVAPSRAFLADCLSVFPSASRRALAIHNGIDLEELTRSDGDAGAGASGPYLLCIAAHNEKKALDVLLRAFARIAPAHPELRLLLVGDGPLRGQLEALARALALGERVEFLGPRGRKEVARLLRGCLVFVLPSRSEPFGMVVAEALACGRPVVASAVGGIPEIVEDGRSGVLVAPDDPEALARAVSRLLDDAALREALAAAGRTRARLGFGCEQMGAAYESLFAALARRELTPSPPRRP